MIVNSPKGELNLGFSKCLYYYHTLPLHAHTYIYALTSHLGPFLGLQLTWFQTFNFLSFWEGHRIDILSPILGVGHTQVKIATHNHCHGRMWPIFSEESRTLMGANMIKRSFKNMTSKNHVNYTKYNNYFSIKSISTIVVIIFPILFELIAFFFFVFVRRQWIRSKLFWTFEEVDMMEGKKKN